MTDVELDERVMALEENAGGNAQNRSYMKGENNIFIASLLRAFLFFLRLPP